MKRARGMTMIEVMIALVLAGVVMTAAIRFFKAMNVSVAGTVDRLDAMQNLRYGIQNLDRELRVAGAGTVEVQPTLVYIGPSVVTFNADLVSLTPNSPTAVYYNPDADANAANEATYAQRYTIPTSSVQYPDTTYRGSGGMISPAETVTYFFLADTSTARSDDYVLMRQVNNNAADVVARNLLPFPGRPFFEWLRTDTLGNLVSVSATAVAPYPALPWRHQTPIHGSFADTVRFGAYIDSIRAVRVNLYATNGQTGTREIQRALVTTVRIPNAGLTKQRSCGDAPIFARTVTATFTGSAAVPVVRLTWTPAVDESGGERDVEKYVLYRRTTGAGTFDDALQSVPAGQTSYTFDDASVLNDSTYIFGVTALDCTPLESPASTTATITIPPHP
jgi:prepilin-type N-terminal cleavage/methylation domain-containing protein